MFLQVLQGGALDADAVRQAFDGWADELSAGAAGWLGTMSGLTDDSQLVALVRFDSAASASRNSEGAEGSRWFSSVSVRRQSCGDRKRPCGGRCHPATPTRRRWSR